MKPARSKPKAGGSRSGTKRALSLPRFVEPMKALGTTAIPAGDWQLEIKFDGYRALSAVSGEGVEIWSRNQLSLAGDYPEIVTSLRRLRCGSALLDGEIVALDGEGRSRFQLLQQRELSRARPPIFYYVFDLLEIDGRSLIAETLEVRRRQLEKIVPKGNGVICISPRFSVVPADLLEEVRKQGLEGIVAKSDGSKYEPGRRSGAWLKCRVMSEQEFVIGGYTPPGGSRQYFGALLLGYYEKGKLRYAGKVGTGFDAAKLRTLHAMFMKRGVKRCPFSDLPRTRDSRFGEPMNAAAMKTVQWLRPDLICQVRFAEWTQEGLLRQPSFLGLRRDKRAKEVVREAPAV